MRHEFRSATLGGAVKQALRPKLTRIARKSSITIDADVGSYQSDRISAYVEKGQRYEISWHASDDALYAIDIQSYDGHGAASETFTGSGSMSFTARITGEVEFAVSVSRATGYSFGSYPVDISID